ncbi:MAG: hypothetical protein WAR57_14165 [Candidatus Phosphoribacter sp.]
MGLAVVDPLALGGDLAVDHQPGGDIRRICDLFGFSVEGAPPDT